MWLVRNSPSLHPIKRKQHNHDNNDTPSQRSRTSTYTYTTPPFFIPSVVLNCLIYNIVFIYIRGRDVESRTDVATSRCTKPAAARRSNQRRRGRPCGPREPSRERETRWKRAGNATFPLAGHPRCNIRHTKYFLFGTARPASAENAPV